MTHRLREASLHVVEGTSLVVPVIIEGLPEHIDTLGQRWERKREFHVTAASTSVIEAAGRGVADLWDVVTRAASGSSLGPITARSEVRRAKHPDKPGLQTLIVMVEAPGLQRLHAVLSRALATDLRPPPPHVTLYSTLPAEGIGIDDEQQLAERAPALSADQQQEVRRAMRFDKVLWDDGGIPPAADGVIRLGLTDPVFTPTVLSALAYAAHVHRDQRRKNSEVPYLAHLIAVAGLVAEDGGTSAQVTAGLLHDTAEDHDGEPRLGDISRRFGPEVELIVRRLSDPPGDDWRARKQRYLARLRTETHEDVLRVCNADKLHNARAIVSELRLHGDRAWERLGRSACDTAWYYGELTGILTDLRPNSRLSLELADTVAMFRA